MICKANRERAHLDQDKLRHQYKASLNLVMATKIKDNKTQVGVLMILTINLRIWVAHELRVDSQVLTSPLQYQPKVQTLRS